MRENDREHLRYLMDEARKHQASMSWERPAQQGKYEARLELVLGDVLSMLDMVVEELAPEKPAAEEPKREQGLVFLCEVAGDGSRFYAKVNDDDTLAIHHTGPQGTTGILIPSYGRDALLRLLASREGLVLRKAGGDA